MPKDKEDKLETEPQTDAEKLAAAEKKLKEQEKELENARGLISKWGNEMGELRKETAKIVTIETSISDLKTLIESLKSVEPGKPKEQPKEETLEEVEKNLTDAEKELAKKKYKELLENPDVSDAEKAAYARDPKKRLAFLKAVKDNTAPTIPEDFFADKPAGTKKQDNADEVLANLFNTKKEQDGYTPPGSSGGSVRAPGSTTKKGEVRPPLQGGILDELDSRRKAS